MSANDGGDPIRLYRDPIPKPFIPRGRTLVPLITFQSEVHPGDRVSFDWQREDGLLTFHRVEVAGLTGGDAIVMVEQGTVVTWIDAEAPKPQI